MTTRNHIKNIKERAQKERGADRCVVAIYTLNAHMLHTCNSHIRYIHTHLLTCISSSSGRSTS